LKLDLVLWLGEKLKADLRNYFRPDNSEEVADLIGELAEDQDQSVLNYIEKVSEHREIDLQEEFDSNPVEQIYDLEDDSGKLYLWKLPSEWSDQQRDNLFARLVTSYREKFNRDPKAAHLLLTELDELKDVDRDEMKSLLGHAANDL